MTLAVTTEPAIEPISLDEAKAHLRVDHSEEDLLIERLVTAARRTVERWEWRTHYTTTYTLYLDAFDTEDGIIYLPRPPLQSITSVKYYDPDDTLQTWASSNYEVDTSMHPGRLRPVSTVTWPTTDDRLNAVEIEYVAGYTTAALVPANTRAAILLLVDHYFNNRGVMTTIQESEPPEHMLGLLDRCKDHRVLAFV